MRLPRFAVAMLRRRKLAAGARGPVFPIERAGLSARDVADQLGHGRVSMTQSVGLGRRILSDDAAATLDNAYRSAREDDDPNADDDGALADVSTH